MIEEIIKNIQNLLRQLSERYNVRYSIQFEERLISDIRRKQDEILNYIHQKKLTQDKIDKSIEVLFIESRYLFEKDTDEMKKTASERFMKTSHLTEAISNKNCRVYPFCAKLLED